MLFFETVHAISFIVHTKDLTIKNIPGLNPEPWVPEHLKIMLKILKNVHNSLYVISISLSEFLINN